MTDREELVELVTDTTSRLVTEVNAAILASNPDAAVRWAEALAAACDGLANLTSVDDD